MKVFKTTFILVALCLATTVYGQKTINKTFSGVENIRLSIASGNGIIKKSNSSEVKVTVEYTYDDDDYEAIIEQRGDVLRMEEDFRNRRRNWNNRGRSEWTVEIPDGLRVNVNTGSGSLEITNLEVELMAKSGSGSVEVADIIGNTRLSTGSGSIRIDKLTGELRANTGSGGIRARDIEGDADLSTGSGSIRAANIKGAMKFRTGSGGVDGTELTITDHSSFSTGSGSVDIELAAALEGDVRLSTGSGSATLDFGGNKIEGRFSLEASSKSRITAPFSFDREYKDGGRYVKEATVGSKDIRIDISTGSGSARVRK